MDNEAVTSYAYYKSLAEGRLSTIHKQRADIAKLRIELWKTEQNYQSAVRLRCDREEALRHVIYQDVTLDDLLKVDKLITDWKQRTSYVLRSLQELDNECLTREQQTAIVHSCVRTLEDMERDDDMLRPRYPMETPDYNEISLDIANVVEH